MESRGELFIVGTGLRIEGQVTQETLEAIRSADKLFHLIQDILTHRWLAEINPTAESLYDCYTAGRPRRESYAETVERIPRTHTRPSTTRVTNGNARCPCRCPSARAVYGSSIHLLSNQ